VGIIASARTTLDDEDGGSWVRGMSYAPEACGGYRAIPGGCAAGLTSVDHTEERPGQIDYAPWTVQAEERCTTLDGRDRGPILERLRRQLAAVESYAIGRELLTGEVTRAEVTAGVSEQPNPYLAEAGRVEVLTTGPTAPARALGMLEEALGHALRGQVAYLHVPLAASGRLAEISAVRVEGNLRRTLRDSQVVLEAGYPNVAPAADADTAPAAAAAGSAWLYGTGLVVVRRGPIEDVARSQTAAIDTARNTYLEAVNRPVAVHYDPCAQFAVQITLED
jgi:hypothetical protein